MQSRPIFLLKMDEKSKQNQSFTEDKPAKSVNKWDKNVFFDGKLIPECCDTSSRSFCLLGIAIFAWQ